MDVEIMEYMLRYSQMLIENLIVKYELTISKDDLTKQIIELCKDFVNDNIQEYRSREWKT